MKTLQEYAFTVTVCALLGLWIASGTSPETPVAPPRAPEWIDIGMGPVRLPSRMEILDLQFREAQIKESLARAKYFSEHQPQDAIE